MESCFKIFQLIASDEDTHLKTHTIDEEIFKYHESNGCFNSYSDASVWLRGLSKLKGQFVIMEVYTK